MTQFNPNTLRSFIDRVKSLKANNGKQIVDSAELNNIALELADLLLYCRSLENQITKLQKQIDESGEITIELKGEKF